MAWYRDMGLGQDVPSGVTCDMSASVGWLERDGRMSSYEAGNNGCKWFDSALRRIGVTNGCRCWVGDGQRRGGRERESG